MDMKTIVNRLFLACALMWVQCDLHSALRESNPKPPSGFGAFNTLTEEGEPSGFFLNGSPDAPGDLAISAMHFQGIQRSSRPGSPIFYVTRSGVRLLGSDVFPTPSSLHIVRLESREPWGERLRSNRLRPDRGINTTPPPANDGVIRWIKYPYVHAGGIQMCGDILAVPLEDPIEDGLPEGRVVFYNAEDPQNPIQLPYTLDITSHKAGVVGLTRLPDGYFLLVVSWGDGDKLDFYRSNRQSFMDDGFRFVFHDRWDSGIATDAVPAVDWPTGHASHQSLSLYVGGEGVVYMVGAYNTQEAQPFLGGDDLLGLYRIDGWQPGSSMMVTKHGPFKHQKCTSDDDVLIPPTVTYRKNADFLAASGIYISPSGELLFYAAEHYSQGPAGCVRFVEFHHNSMARPASPLYSKAAIIEDPAVEVPEGSIVPLDGRGSRPQIVKPWIDLFSGQNFSGRRVVIDWPDRLKDDYQDFRKLDGFNDDASSCRWWAPPGWTIRLFDADNFHTDEPILTLTCDGTVRSISKLSDFGFDNGDTININETRVTSVAFVPPFNGFPLTPPDFDLPLTYGWSLIGSDAQNARLISNSASVAALEVLEGPALVAVQLDLGPSPNEQASIKVVVTNVPPSIDDLLLLRDPNPWNLVVAVNALDPGKQDKLTLRIDWGDGTPATVVAGALGDRNFKLRHDYQDNDPSLPLQTRYALRIRVSDDDGGVVEKAEVYTVTWRNATSVIDADKDGLPDYWEDQAFGGRRPTATGDEDSDGASNLDEYKAGTNPTDASSVLRLDLLRNGSRKIELGFNAIRAEGAGYGTLKRFYRLESSPSLLNPVWTAVVGYEAIEGKNQRVKVPFAIEPGRNLYFRVIVTLQ